MVITRAVLKTVCPQGRRGSNPHLSVGRFAAEFNKEMKSANCRSTQAVKGLPGKGVGRSSGS